MPRKKAAFALPKTNKEGRPYISYSQYSKFKKDKKDYIRSYFFGDRFEGNAYTDFGSLVGEALENNDFSAFDDRAAMVLKEVTRLDQFEREITWDLGDFVVTGYIDTNDLIGEADQAKIVKTIIDYKTGALNKEAVYEDDEYDQIAIYAGALEQETGFLPEKAWVELIERTGNPYRGETLEVGNAVVKIPQKITRGQIAKTKKSVIETAKDISDHFAVFNKLNAVKV